MKIVCDACQAKYSISDDKVQGKVFKIRCKKCSNIIVVRGGAQAAEPAPVAQEKDTRVYDYGYDGGGGAPADDAVWHLVINQDQVGPMTAGEVQQRFAAGEVDGETFAWREGFSDWLPLAQVDVFAGLIASGSTTAASSGGGGAHAVAAMFGGGDDLGGGTARSDSGDLFAAASASSSHHADDDGGDVFGGSQRAAKGGGGAAASAQKMRGERNENSVLFSLNNLAQLASDKPAPASAPAGHATGAAGGEGSGLIDIRSMASAYLGGSGAAVAKPASSGIGSIDDLPVFGGGGFSEPAVIVPTAARGGNNKILYIMIGVVGLFAITAVIMVVILLKGNKPTQVAENTKPTEGETKGSDKPAETKPDQPAATASGSGSDSGSAAPSAGSATQVAANDTKAPAHPTTTTTPQPAVAPHHDTTPVHTTSTPTHTVASNTPPPSHHESPSKTPPSGGGDAGGGGGSCDEVSCVLNNYEGACCAKFKKGKSGGGGGGGGGGGSTGGGGASNLPDALDKGMISGAIASVKGRVSSCGDKSSAKGVVKVHVKVGGDGRVANVSVSQTPDPALGACVAAAVQKASFPKTQSGGSFSYPFVF
ncbi:MAG TPA: GYF domain-containing protein [Kofleriaceae bacterium]|nr:GYF domain-containing protein [Kofleriaceae bacterium]